MSRISTRSIIAMVLLFSVPAGATIYYGYADEFLGGIIECRTDTGNQNNGCAIHHYWAGENWVQSDIYDYMNQPTWSVVGTQGADTTGRTNAREKFMFKFRDANTGSFVSVTATVTRFKASGNPLEGSTCDGTIGGTTVSSVSQTMESVGTTADFRLNNRLLPIFDFKLETAGSGTNVAYLESLTITGNMGVQGSATKWGCFKIPWT